jgi:adenylate kinase family enzyme
LIQLNQFKGRRILIIGRPCSGKTILGQRLAAQIEIPLFDLDDVYWHSGWQRPSESEFNQRLMDILKKDEWIISGNYLKNLPLRLEFCSDLVILDSSWYLASYRYFARIAKRAFGHERSAGYSAWYKEFRVKFFFSKILFYLRFYKQFNEIVSEGNHNAKVHRCDACL